MTASNDPVAKSFDKWHRKLISGTYSRHDAACGGSMALVAFQFKGWPGAAEYLQKLEAAFIGAVAETAGGRLKAALLADFEFAEAEMVIVEEACRVADILERIEGELGSALLLTAGSRGQDVENPLLRSARDHGAHLIKLLSALRLPGVDDESESAATRAGRKAAMVRWHGRAR